jgi:hydrogenase nickel incorporation protein HypA/HybF
VHELALAESVLAAIRDRIGAAPVERVRLAVGRRLAVLPDALRFCFQVCTEGTLLAGARLEIEEIAGRARCRGCGQETAIEALSLCHCGSADLEILAGEELRIIDVLLRVGVAEPRSNADG